MLYRCYCADGIATFYQDIRVAPFTVHLRNLFFIVVCHNSNAHSV
jgi:hypothetical protein